MHIDAEIPTPADEVAALRPAQREERVWQLMGQAQRIVNTAIDTHLDGRVLSAKVVLYSGGNDSTVLMHLMRQLGHATHAAHANTTIGIEDTRVFVRSTCAQWGIPLVEKYPPISYRDLVIAHGFPGPGHHYKMYQRLKERCLRQVRNEFVTDHRTQRVLFIAGRRRAESARRSTFRASGKHAVPLHEREGSTIWASPLALWTALDMNTYRRMNPGVPTNPVTEMLHMSGECLCGSFAKEGELEEIRFWFPAMAAEIEALQEAVAAVGWTEPHCRWGHMAKGKSVRTGRLCSSCEFAEEAS